MTRRTIFLSMLSVATLVTIAACRKSPATAAAPAAMSDAELARLRADSIAASVAMRRREDSITAARMAVTRTTASVPAPDPTRVRAEVLETLTQKVYFDYDQDSLRTETRTALDAKAAVLSANGSISIVVTGHTDERGTAEYNLALGQRRAAQVKRYLMNKGVAEGRITTQSLGDSQPASQGTDDAAYQQNRRAEFVAQNASGALMRPGT